MTQLNLFDLPEDLLAPQRRETGRLINGAWVDPVVCDVCQTEYQNQFIFEMNGCGINVPAAPAGVCFGLWWRKYRFGSVAA